MQLSKFSYYSDFVVYPITVVALTAANFKQFTWHGGREWLAVMQAVHGGEYRHAMQGYPVQHTVFQQGPQHQARQARTEPFPASMPGKLLKILRPSARPP